MELYSGPQPLYSGPQPLYYVGVLLVYVGAVMDLELNPILSLVIAFLWPSLLIIAPLFLIGDMIYSDLWPIFKKIFWPISDN